MNVLSIIEELASNNSRLFKEGVLAREKDNELLKKVLVAALDPTIRYYIEKNIPANIEQHPNSQFTMETALEELDKLAKRIYTGNEAITHLTYLLMYSPYDVAKVVLMIVNKDLRCGVSGSTVNKIWKGLITDIPYQRCSLLKDMKAAPWEDGLFSQKKADGSFAYVKYENVDAIQMFTRAGSQYDIGKFTPIINEFILRNHSGVFSGELTVLFDGKTLPREEGNGILNSVLQGQDFPEGYTPSIEIWDVIPCEDFVSKGASNSKYSARFSMLTEVFSHLAHIKIIETIRVYSLKDAMQHFQDMLNQGFEGTILKFPQAVWKDSTSKEMFKLKVDFEVELEAVGYNDGYGKNAQTFGSIIFKSCDDIVEVGVSGFKDKEREDIAQNKELYIGKIATVRGNSIMKPTENNEKYSIFLPRFIEWRNDKSVADTYVKIQAQYDAIVRGEL